MFNIRDNKSHNKMLIKEIIFNKLWKNGEDIRNAIKKNQWNNRNIDQELFYNKKRDNTNKNGFYCIKKDKEKILKFQEEKDMIHYFLIVINNSIYNDNKMNYDNNIDEGMDLYHPAVDKFFKQYKNIKNDTNQ